jgi:hypothetical protein
MTDIHRCVEFPRGQHRACQVDGLRPRHWRFEPKADRFVESQGKCGLPESERPPIIFVVGQGQGSTTNSAIYNRSSFHL